jgi:hypothetical protein
MAIVPRSVSTSVDCTGDVSTNRANVRDSEKRNNKRDGQGSLGRHACAKYRLRKYPLPRHLLFHLKAARNSLHA